eukprot:gene17502-18513_t
MPARLSGVPWWKRAVLGDIVWVSISDGAWTSTVGDRRVERWGGFYD